MKVNQEEIPRRKRGGFLENRIEEKRGKTENSEEKRKKYVNLSRYRNRREKPEKGRKTRTMAAKNEESRN